MPRKKGQRRQAFTIKIGPELMELMKQQMLLIKHVTRGVSDGSFWEAGEIMAKKFKNRL